MATDNIYPREMARRKAIWELACFAPGDPMASDILDVLDAIDAQDSDSHLPSAALSIDEVASSVPKESLPSGIWIVRERKFRSHGWSDFGALALGQRG
jgi:hypothetical protein